jgi:hypothetical protein
VILCLSMHALCKIRSKDSYPSNKMITTGYTNDLCGILISIKTDVYANKVREYKGI